MTVTFSNRYNRLLAGLNPDEAASRIRSGSGSIRMTGTGS